MPLDPERFRPEFPALASQTYLNFAGVAPTSTRVARAVSRWVDDLVQNGVKNEHRWEEDATRTRAQCAALIGARLAEIAFVRNTSHGLGLVAEGLPWREGDEVAVCTALEYPSNVYPWLHLRDRGVVVRDIAPTGDGVTPEAVQNALTPRTRLVAVSSVQYATGHRTDLASIGEVCRRANVLFCVDGIQSIGCVPVDPHACGIHFVSADSHKWMLGMPGIGFLYVDAQVLDRVRPLLVGWKSTTDAWNFDRAHFELRKDAAKLEEGSPAYTGIAALGATTEILLDAKVADIAARIESLLARLDEGLRRLGCTTAPGPEARAGILTFLPPARFAGGPSALHAALVARDVSVSLRRGRIRASPHFLNREDEIDRVIALVAELTSSTG